MTNKAADVLRILKVDGKETEEIFNGERFRFIKPVECKSCGNRDDFERKLFQTEGIRSEGERNIARMYMKEAHNIEGFIFRTDGRKHYMEAAFCSKCKSDNIVFDIPKELVGEATKTFQEEIAKIQ